MSPGAYEGGLLSLGQSSQTLFFMEQTQRKLHPFHGDRGPKYINEM